MFVVPAEKTPPERQRLGVPSEDVLPPPFYRAPTGGYARHAIFSARDYHQKSQLSALPAALWASPLDFRASGLNPSTR